MTDKPRKPGRRKLTPALARIAQRALQVSDQDVAAYEPTELDVAIAQEMLSGTVLQQDMAKHIGVSASLIGRQLKDPISCAWISRQVHSLVRYRLGLADAAIFNRAVNGDVRAYEAINRRFGTIVSRSEVKYQNVGSPEIDYNQLSDADLDKIIHSRAKRPQDIPPAPGVPPKPKKGSVDPEAS